MAGRDWIGQYSESHQHPVNRAMHTFGIPMIALSIPCFVAALFAGKWIWPALVLFVVGWIFQFIGHYYEKKPPEFLSDPRFVFVGLRWWLAKVRGKV